MKGRSEDREERECCVTDRGVEEVLVGSADLGMFQKSDSPIRATDGQTRLMAFG